MAISLAWKVQASQHRATMSPQVPDKGDGGAAGAQAGPDAGKRALPADPRFILEPHLQGFVAGVIRQGPRRD